MSMWCLLGMAGPIGMVRTVRCVEAAAHGAPGAVAELEGPAVAPEDDGVLAAAGLHAASSVWGQPCCWRMAAAWVRAMAGWSGGSGQGRPAGSAGGCAGA